MIGPVGIRWQALGHRYRLSSMIALVDGQVGAVNPFRGSRTPLEELLEVIERSRPAFHADAACREHPHIDFFASNDGAVLAAKAVCGGCLVVDDCQTWALAQTRLDGVWGGLSAEEIRITSTAPVPSPATVATPSRPRPRPVPAERSEISATCALCRLDVFRPRMLAGKPYHGHCHRAVIARRRRATRLSA